MLNIYRSIWIHDLEQTKPNPNSFTDSLISATFFEKLVLETVRKLIYGYTS